MHVLFVRTSRDTTLEVVIVLVDLLTPVVTSGNGECVFIKIGYGVQFKMTGDNHMAQVLTTGAAYTPCVAKLSEMQTKSRATGESVLTQKSLSVKTKTTI